MVTRAGGEREVLHEWVDGLCPNGERESSGYSTRRKRLQLSHHTRKPIRNRADGFSRCPSELRGYSPLVLCHRCTRGEK